MLYSVHCWQRGTEVKCVGSLYLLQVATGNSRKGFEKFSDSSGNLVKHKWEKQEEQWMAFGHGLW